MTAAKLARRHHPKQALPTARLGVEALEARCLMDAAGTAFVVKSFNDLLGRPAEPAAVNFFSSLLDQGTTRTQLVLTIERSPEYLKGYADAAFQTYLGRAADPAGEAFAVQLLASTGSPDALVSLLTSSPEYFATRGGNTNAGYVDALFQDLLHRPADAGALTFYSGVLDAGAARSQVFSTVNQTSEARRAAVNDVFQMFLGRPADIAGSNTFLAALTQGATIPQVIAVVLASPEYAPGGEVSMADNAILPANEVLTLLARASAATPTNDGIIVIVDRGGNILGVNVENGVSAALTGNAGAFTFAIDGAVSLARTGAFFANDQGPLTSRTVQFISQTTITERMVNSSPDVADLNSPLYGPGLVAPIQIGGHFPPKVPNTPQVDLLGIEFTNRDSSVFPGPDGMLGTPDDIILSTRFNVDPAYIPASIPTDQQLNAPDSYGISSELFPAGQSRGIATLPGGVPIYRMGTDGKFHVVGGIGVFYPGATGYASESNSILSADYNPAKPDRSLEAEFAAFAAVGGAPLIGLPIGTLGGIPALPNIAFPLTPDQQRIDLAGITLDIVGPGGIAGPGYLVSYGLSLGQGINTGSLQSLGPTLGPTTISGVPVPDGWLVLPHDGVGINAAQVTQMISQGILQASQTRAAIRLPLGSTTSMTFAVTDETGEVLGLYRMPDSTVFSIGVAVAKARNVAYYNDAAKLQAVDQLPGVPAGFAFTARTFRYLSQPFFPEGVGPNPGIWSPLNDIAVNSTNAMNIGPALPASAYTSMIDFIAFNPQANFHDTANPLNQNGVVLFPGSSSVYVTLNGLSYLVGGLGVSGDGVDQDDVVTGSSIIGYAAPMGVRIDNVTFRGVRLPYQKFSRNPTGT
jgi:uncharacterized protein GlcG (DUF336 family)